MIVLHAKNHKIFDHASLKMAKQHMYGPDRVYAYQGRHYFKIYPLNYGVKP